MQPSDLTGPGVQFMPDGGIYNVITNGIAVMAAYKDQVPVVDRWAIVAYVRALQLSQKKGRFFRHIGVPNQHILRKADIRPEHGPAIKPLTQIMIMFNRDGFGKFSLALQPHGVGKITVIRDNCSHTIAAVAIIISDSRWR